MRPAKLALVPAAFALAAGLAGTIAGYLALVAQAPNAAQTPHGQRICHASDLGGGEVAIPHRSMGNRPRICVQRGRLRRRGRALSSCQARLLQLHDRCRG